MLNSNIHGVFRTTVEIVAINWAANSCGTITNVKKYIADIGRRHAAMFEDETGLKLYGPSEGQLQTATVSFTVEGMNANDIARKLADIGIFVWDGEFYAIATIWEVLKLQPYGGMLRIGMAPYLLESDVDRAIAAIREICGIRA